MSVKQIGHIGESKDVGAICSTMGAFFPLRACNHGWAMGYIITINDNVDTSESNAGRQLQDDKETIPAKQLR